MFQIKLTITTIFLIFQFPNFLICQIEFSGYLESEFDHIKFLKTDYNFGYNKLRLDFESRPTDAVLISGNINFQKYYGNTEWDLTDFIPENTVGESIVFNISDTMFLDNIYLRTSFQKFDITIGSQPISLGTGYAWNPLDIFNSKDLIDPTYEQPGVNALRVEIPLGRFWTIDGIISPDTTIKMSTKMLQLKTTLSSFDLSANWAQQYHLLPFWETDDTSFTHELTEFLGTSYVGELMGLGTWGEALFSMNAVKNYGEFVFGFDRTMTNGFYFMAEYFHNSLGAQKNNLDFTHYMNYYSSETHSLMQNYIFTMCMYPLTDILSSSILAFGNLDDNSFIIAPQFEWDVFENVTFSTFISQTIGDTDSEFGIQKNAVRFRLRAYF